MYILIIQCEICKSLTDNGCFGKIIEFNNIKKNFEYVRRLGVGGTGDTHLLKDSTTNMEFAFKKYVPKNETKRSELYERFVDEIKILFNISHPNIVRIYNYYLYPEIKLGYLQMEYIEGTSIDKYQPFLYNEWNNIFVQVINVFRYLERKKILHRDIRPQNILIEKEGNVKIIDFGFGKILEKQGEENNSVLLNWPISRMPEEISLKGEYTYYTEIYFIGKLFEYILANNKVTSEQFNYFNVLNKMIEYQVNMRYQSFDEVYSDISNGIFSTLDFTEEEKDIYGDFTNSIHDKISEYKNEYSPITNIENIIGNIANVLRKNSLEIYIQNNADLIQCFITNGFSYNGRTNIEKEKVEWFYKWLISLPNNKQINVVENINNKLSNIKINKEYDDLPF